MCLGTKGNIYPSIVLSVAGTNMGQIIFLSTHDFTPGSMETVNPGYLTWNI